LLLDFQIGIGLKGGSRADCRNSVCEIQPRIAERHIMGEQVVSVEEVAHVEKMIVHANESGKRCMSGEVDTLRVCRNVDGAGRAECGDVAAGCDNRLVLFCWRSSAVDDGGMFESNDWRRHANEFFPSLKALRRNRRQQFVHFAEAPVPAALVLTAGLVVLKTELGQ